MGKFDIYSFHEQYYLKALKTIEQTAGEKYMSFLEEYGGDCPEEKQGRSPGGVSRFSEEGAYPFIGWLSWFEQTHPDLYRKYAGAIDRIVKLWGNMNPQAMEDFKAAVKIEIEATQWAVDKFMACRLESLQADRLKGKQETLAI